MRLTRLQVSNFRCIDHVDLNLDHDWVVIHGPNDIGKSTLAAAVRMALLGRIGSTIWDDYQPWGTTSHPEITLDFRLPDSDVTYRVTKRRTTALLQLQAAGSSQFHDEQRDKGVNEYLFKRVLRWGLGAPSKYQGMASSFVAEILFAEQDKVSWILSGDAKGIQEDKSETAREWLTEALEAKALDPEFREMLDNVANRCNVFFTNTGRYRRGADSPLKKLQEEIEEVRTQKEALDEQWESMSSVRGEHHAAVRELETLHQTIEELDNRLEAAVEDEKVRKAYGAARAAWEAADKRATKIGDLETKVSEKHTELEQLDGRLREAKSEEEAAREKQQAAQNELRALESGDADVDKERRRGELKEQLADARTRLQDLEHRLESAKTTLDRWNRLQAATEALASHHERSEELNEDLDRKRAVLDRARKELRVRTAWEIKTRRDQAAEKVRALEAKARAVGEQTAELDEKLGVLNQRLNDLPTGERVEELVALEQQLNVARGKLSVGLSLELALESPRTITATIDDETQPPKTEASIEWQADRTATLVINGVGRFIVRAGDQSQHRELEGLQAKWNDIGAPVLRQTGLSTADDLLREHKSLSSRKANLEAEGREASADSPTDEQLDDARRALKELQRELDELGEVDGLEEAAHLPDVTELNERVERSEGVVQSLETQLEVHANRITDTKKDVAERREEAGDDIAQRAEDAQALVAGAEDDRQQLNNRIRSLDEQLRELDGAQATELEEARDKVARCKREFEEAKAQHEALAEERQSLSDAVATLRGELKTSREGFDSDELNRLRDKLDTTPRPATSEPIDIEELQLELGREQRRRGELERKIATLAGHIQSATGPAAKEQLEALTERLERLEEEEKRLLTDAHGWKLLDDVMKEVEATEAGNLGASIVPLVEPRIREIAGPRYSLDVDPTLAGSGSVKTPGGLQELSKISVGTREQIATLFRLALAERLQSTVILDDQLVQSDLHRMDKLLSILREVSQRAQILVFTCRPDEYRVEDAKMIDLQRELSMASAS